jgi:small conductance mechanosensitive channel
MRRPTKSMRLIVLGSSLIAATAIAAAPSSRGQDPITETIAKQLAQDKGAPDETAKPGAAGQGEDTAKVAPEHPEAAVAQTSAPIDVEHRLDERKVKQFLETTLAKYPGVYEIHADVEGNVVTLTGVVEDEAVRIRLRDVALKVEGVVFVVNKVKTIDQVLSASDRLMRRLSVMGRVIAENWLLFLLALAIIAGAFLLARLFARHGEWLLVPFAGNALLRSVLGSVISGVIILAGLYAGLQVFGVAQAIFSVLGIAGIVALALGFAFRDIAENFIASVLLGLRRPFRVGDYVQIAGQAGIIKALNTRATVLVTLDGHYVRIPNATVFKSIQVNQTAAGRVRSTFDVQVPYTASAARATEAIGAALRDFDGLLDDPAPRALVEALEPNAVRLRVYYWAPAQGIDGFKLNSDVRLRVKAALQQVGIVPGMSPSPVELAGPIALRRETPSGDGRREASKPGASNGDRQVRANLLRDQRAAEAAANRPAPEADTAREMLTLGGDAATDEGTNLLSEAVEASSGSPDGNGQRTDGTTFSVNP